RSRAGRIAVMRLSFVPQVWAATGIVSNDKLKPIYTTDLGRLYEGDCLGVLPAVNDGVVDMVFADPPFNLGKKYGKSCDDDRPHGEYVTWCKRWIDESIRVLKPGGAFFLYNL